MDSESEFLQEILAHPREDGPRRVFADWLEEQGDPRGAWIQLQCALAEFEPADERRFPLEQALQKLWLNQSDLFQEPVRFLDLRHFGWSGWYRRGFIERAVLGESAFFFHGHMLWDALPLLNEICLVNLSPSSAARLVKERCFPRIHALDLSDIEITTLLLRELLSAPTSGLKRMNLSHCALGPVTIRMLVQSALAESLEHLDLCENRFGSQGTKALAASTRLSHLRSLDISESTTCSGLELRRARSLQQLETLQARSCQVTRESLAGFMDLPAIRHLDVSDNPTLGAAGERGLFLSEGRNRLETMCLNSCGLGDLQVLGLEHPFPALRVLEFSQNRLTDEGLAPLANDFPALRILRMGENPIGVDGILMLLETPWMPKLTHLDVWANEVTDEGAEALAESPQVGALQVLNLGNNELTTAGVRFLAESRHFKSLEVLNLSRNEFGDEGARALARSSGLRRLKCLILRDNEISPEALRPLHERFGEALLL